MYFEDWNLLCGFSVFRNYYYFFNCRSVLLGVKKTGGEFWFQNFSNFIIMLILYTGWVCTSLITNLNIAITFEILQVDFCEKIKQVHLPWKYNLECLMVSESRIGPWKLPWWTSEGANVDLLIKKSTIAINYCLIHDPDSQNQGCILKVNGPICIFQQKATCWPSWRESNNCTIVYGLDYNQNT